MSLTLLQNYKSIANNIGLSVPFGASGGTGPYTFSVAGTAGGTVGSATGIYTASGQVGVDVVTVRDSLNVTASGSIACMPALSLVADVIKTSMGLANDQVYLYDQKYDIPKDQRLYVAVGVNSLKPFGNRPSYVGGSSAVTAVQTVNITGDITIHVLSRSTQALYRKEQVLLALSSPYAESQMELNSFYVAPVTTSIIDVSEIDGAAIPYHFLFTTKLQYFSRLDTTPGYFDTFSPVAVTTDP